MILKGSVYTFMLKRIAYRRLACLSCIVLVLVITVRHSAFAQSSFNYNSDIKKAYSSIINLKFEEAQFALDNIKAEDPNNLAVYHIENYIDFFQIFKKVRQV